MLTQCFIASRAAARAISSTVTQGAAAGAAGGMILPGLLSGVATLIAAQADRWIAYGMIVFMCVQIGVAVAVLFAVLEPAYEGGEQ